LLVKTNPRGSKWINKSELEYIKNDQIEIEIKSTPYKKFFKEPAVWAIMIAQVSYNFGWFHLNYFRFTLLGWLPTYFKSKGVPFEHVGWFTMLPYLTLFITINIVGIIADLMKRIKFGNYKIPIVFVRKFFQTTSFLGSSFFYFLLPYAETPISAAILVCCAVAFCSLSKSGYWVNHIDIGPVYAGPLMGITNTFGSIPGIAANIIAGYILQFTGSFNYVFYCIIVIQLFGCLLYLIFARGDLIFPPSSEENEFVDKKNFIETFNDYLDEIRNLKTFK